MQSQALNYYTEKEAQSFKVPSPPPQGHPRPLAGLVWLASLNPDWFNTKGAATPSLDHYKALIKSIHLPGNQFPVADAGVKGTHMHAAKARILLNTASAPVCLQPPAAAERAHGCGHMALSCRTVAEPRVLLCPGQWCAPCSHSHAGSLLLVNQSCHWKRDLRLARILFKMLRSSKAEISASWGKREVFHCELQ